MTGALAPETDTDIFLRNDLRNDFRYIKGPTEPVSKCSDTELDAVQVDQLSVLLLQLGDDVVQL